MTTPYVFTAYVHLADQSGTPHPFAPGDPIPEWALPLVGDHVIAEAPPLEFVAAVEAEAFTDPTPAAETAEAFTPDTDLPAHPPTKGPGSGQDKWYAWAADVGAVAEIGITRSWTRQDIVDSLIRHGYLHD